MRIQPRTQGWRIWCVQTAGLGILTCFTSCWTDTKIPAVNSSQALKKDRSIIPEPASPCLQDLVGDSFKKTWKSCKNQFNISWSLESFLSTSSAQCQLCSLPGLLRKVLSPYTFCCCFLTKQLKNCSLFVFLTCTNTFIFLLWTVQLTGIFPGLFITNTGSCHLQKIIHLNWLSLASHLTFNFSH